MAIDQIIDLTFSFVHVYSFVSVCVCVFIWYMIFTFLKKSLTTYRITFSDKRIHKDLTNIKNHYCSFFSECVKYVCFVRKKKWVWTNKISSWNLFFLSFFLSSFTTYFIFIAWIESILLGICSKKSRSFILSIFNCCCCCCHFLALKKKIV